MGHVGDRSTNASFVPSPSNLRTTVHRFISNGGNEHAYSQTLLGMCLAFLYLHTPGGPMTSTSSPPAHVLALDGRPDSCVPTNGPTLHPM